MVTVKVTFIMGKNACDANDASPELHRCMGSIVAATQEPDSTHLFSTSICKAMGPGDPLSARALYNNTVEFKFHALLSC